MMADVLRAEPLLTRHHTFAKLFRFPLPRRGQDGRMRDGMHALLGRARLPQRPRYDGTHELLASAYFRRMITGGKWVAIDGAARRVA